MNFAELRRDYWQAMDIIENDIRLQLTTYLTPIYSGFFENSALFSEIAEDDREYDETYYIRLNSENKIVCGNIQNYHICLTMCNDIMPLLDLVDDYYHELEQYINIGSKYKLLHNFLQDISKDIVNINITEKLWELYGNYTYSELPLVNDRVWLLPFKYPKNDDVYLKQDSIGYFGYSFNSDIDRIHPNTYYYRSHIAAIYAAIKHCNLDILTFSA